MVALAGLVEEAELRRITVDELLRMDVAGIFDSDERIELLDGMIVRMSPINPPHARSVDRLGRALGRALPDSVDVRIRNPVQLSTYSLPEPEVAIVQALGEVYEQRHPRPEEILLLIEVSGTTLRRDRIIKLPLYAAAGIPELWIVDLVHRQLLVHHAPLAQEYTQVVTYAPGDVVAPLTFPELQIEVASLFPGGY